MKRFGIPGRRGALASALLILSLLAGCATSPYVERDTPPEWVTEPPASTGEHEFFVATGTDASGDIGAAEEAAAGSLLTQINQALGVDVTVLTTSEARATLDSYEASVRRQVTQSGSGRVEGFRIADRYLVADGDRITVHLLGEYERGAFAAERAERRALLSAREALFTEPESRADAAARAGDIADAVRGYLQAALAATEASEMRLAPIVLERSLAKAVDLTAGLTVSARSGPEAVETGRVPEEPVEFAVLDATGRPVSGLPLEIAHPHASGDRTVIRRTVVVADSEGIARAELSRVELVGEIEVTARIDVSAYRDLLDGLPESVAARRSTLENALASPRASWKVTAYSRAAEVPTTLVIAEADAAGVQMPSSHTADGVAQALSQAGFRLVAAGSESLAGLQSSQTQIIRHLQNTVPAEADRVVFGTARIVEFTESDGYLAKVSATLTVMDLATEEIVYTTSGVKNARSASADQSLATAFLQLGRMLGERLAANLR
ncbi:MAG: hypothetical protein ACOC2Y_06245 [Spirochaetota bacterium]